MKAEYRGVTGHYKIIRSTEKEFWLYLGIIHPDVDFSESEKDDESYKRDSRLFN